MDGAAVKGFSGPDTWRLSETAAAEDHLEMVCRFQGVLCNKELPPVGTIE